MLFPALVLSLLSYQPAEASHFRYGTLSWTSDGSGNVEFSLVAAFRNGYGVSSVGDTFSETIGGTSFDFGDGSSTGTLEFEVIDINPGDNFVIAVALDPDTGERGIEHSYSGSGPFTAQVSGCCRIFDLNNRSSDAYRLTTSVLPTSTNGSPTTSLNPIVKVTENTNAATFTIPAADSEGDDFRFRVASNSEATGSTIGDGTPTFSIDANTGVVTLNTNTLSGSDPYWTEQVIIEELDDDGNVRTVTPIDFFIEEVPVEGNPPVITIDPSGPLTANVGDAITFDVEATDPDAGETIDLNLNSALPSGASMSPAPPLSGSSPQTSTFSWTPSSGQEGSYVFNFTAEDSDEQQDQESITIEVQSASKTDETAPVCGPITTDQNSAGKLIAVNSSASDAESGIAGAEFVTLRNLDGHLNGTGGYVEGDTESFDAATTSSVSIRGERIDMSAGGAIVVEITNGEGLTSLCDPVASTVSSEQPAAYSLAANYPNPFNPSTTIEFRVREAGFVSLRVYNMLGREVKTLVNEDMTPGTYEVQWDATNNQGQTVPSGSYIYRLESGVFARTRIMTLVK